MKKTLILLFAMITSATVFAQIQVVVPSGSGTDTLILQPGPIGDQVIYTPDNAWAIGQFLWGAVISLLVYLSYYIKPLRKLPLPDNARARTIVVGLLWLAGFAGFGKEWLPTFLKNIPQILSAAGMYSLILKDIFGKSKKDDPIIEPVPGKDETAPTPPATPDTDTTTTTAGG